MSEKTDNRCDARKAERASIFYTFQDSKQIYGARMLNTSRDGMCFQTGYAITPGREIFIFLNQPQPDIPPVGVHGARLAKVQWCDNIPECEAFFYRVGIKFV